MTPAETSNPPADEGAAIEPFQGSSEPLAQAYDVALLDLDGVVYRGDTPVVHAAEALSASRGMGMRLAFVTNNALRPPPEVVRRIRAAGVEAADSDVVTSAQAAARLLAQQLPEGSPVLVAGGEGLWLAVSERGLIPVSKADDHPLAVVSGYDPTLDYARLAEAVLAIFHGALWVASNTDATVPTERGLLPGAGALVAFIATATRATPQVAGKPERALHEEATARSRAERPLVVGDRLDTDIEGANRAGAPSLLVLTGVAALKDVITAPPVHRPTFLGADLRTLLAPAPAVQLERDSRTAACGGWQCTASDGRLTWSGKPSDGSDGSNGLDAFRAGVKLHWALVDAGTPPTGISGDVPSGCEAFAGVYDSSG